MTKPLTVPELLATRLGRKLGNWIGRADFFIDTFINAMRDEYDRHLATLAMRFRWQAPIVVVETPPEPPDAWRRDARWTDEPYD